MTQDNETTTPEASTEEGQSELSGLVMRLRRFNNWQRGAEFEQPEPIEIGNDIDAAIKILESTSWIRCSERMPDPGVPVIAFVRWGETATRRIRAQYAAEKTLEQSIECEGGIYDEETDTYWVEPGWYETNEFEQIHWAVDGDVTHWMPLPKPPFDA